MHDDQPDPDDELAELISAQQLADDETELSEHDINAHTLSIRRADGSEVVTVVSAVGSGQQWSVYMQPGGGLQNAYLGGQDNPRVWVNTHESSVSRDEDGMINCIDSTRTRRPAAVLPVTTMVPASASKSFQRSASSSEGRRPVVMRRVMRSTGSRLRHRPQKCGCRLVRPTRRCGAAARCDNSDA